MKWMDFGFIAILGGFVAQSGLKAGACPGNLPILPITATLPPSSNPASSAQLPLLSIHSISRLLSKHADGVRAPKTWLGRLLLVLVALLIGLMPGEAVWSWMPHGRKST